MTAIITIGLRVLLVLVFVALLVTTALTLAPCGLLAILAFRAGWIGTGLIILSSIVLNILIAFWVMDHIRLPSST